MNCGIRVDNRPVWLLGFEAAVVPQQAIVVGLMFVHSDLVRDSFVLFQRLDEVAQEEFVGRQKLQLLLRHFPRKTRE